MYNIFGNGDRYVKYKGWFFYSVWGGRGGGGKGINVFNGNYFYYDCLVSVYVDCKLFFLWKNFYGMIFLKCFFLFGIRRDGFLNFRISRYKLNFYEILSGMKFIMIIDLIVGNIRDILY